MADRRAEGAAHSQACGRRRLKLATDENFNGDIIRGLRARVPGLDLVRIVDAGLRGAPDPEVLQWTAGEDRLLLTHDAATMPRPHLRD